MISDKLFLGKSFDPNRNGLTALEGEEAEVQCAPHTEGKDSEMF